MIGKIIKKIILLFFKNKYAKKKYTGFFYFLYLQSLKGMDFGYKYVYPNESGEEIVLEKIRDFYKGGKVVVFDVGANSGYYADIVLKIFNNNVAIHCFEPSKYTFNLLSQHVKSHLFNKYNIALSNVQGKLVLHSDKLGSGIASVIETSYSPPFSIDKNMAEDIDAETLDAFCKSHSIEHIDFLKIDVEGFEMAVLEGGKMMIETNRIGFIQFEFGHPNVDARSPLKEFYKLLSPYYDFYRVISDGLIHCGDYNYEYEIYLGTNYLAVNKELLRKQKFEWDS